MWRVCEGAGWGGGGGEDLALALASAPAPSPLLAGATPQRRAPLPKTSGSERKSGAGLVGHNRDEARAVARTLSVAVSLFSKVLAEPRDNRAKMPKPIIGKVLSKKMAKTAMVLVSKPRLDTFLMAQYVHRKKYMCHDPDNACSVGDTVRIEKTRPISKRKHHMVSEVIHKAR